MFPQPTWYERNFKILSPKGLHIRQGGDCCVWLICSISLVVGLRLDGLGVRGASLAAWYRGNFVIYVVSILLYIEHVFVTLYDILNNKKTPAARFHGCRHIVEPH